MIDDLGNSFKKALTLFATLIFCLTLLSWSIPVQAATRIDPKLEEQVLQIIRQHPEAILESIQAYQQQGQQRIQQAQQSFLQQLATNPQAVIGDSPTTGASSAKIVLVEFSDFECPFCSQASKTLQEFMTKHQDEVKLVYKHFPLSAIHPEALPAAKAAWAADKQGKFWEYQDALFTNQKQLGEGFYLATARSLNLDIEQFNRDRDRAGAAIQKDINLAEQLGIEGTPFFVMNNVVFTGALPLSELEKILDKVKQEI